MRSSAGPCRPGDIISLQHKRLRQLLARQPGSAAARAGEEEARAPTVPRPGSPPHASLLGEPRAPPWAGLLELGSLSLHPWGRRLGGESQGSKEGGP